VRFYIRNVFIDILVKMASSLASIAETWPENLLPQWQQKIALRAKNPSGRAARDESLLFAGRMDFLR
jgi:hypothetical protein